MLQSPRDGEESAWAPPPAQASPAPQSGPVQVPHSKGDAVEGASPSAQATAPLVAHWAESGNAQEGGQEGAAKPPITITDPTAYIRTPPPALQSTQQKIPVGTRVDVLQEQTVGGRKFIEVKDHDTGKVIGWTARTNGEDLNQKYAAAGAPHVYNVNGYDLLVYTSPDLKPPTADVFMFFHGDGGDYTSRKTNVKDGGYEDNTAISAHVPEGVAQSGRNMVAILPQAKTKKSPEWATLTPAAYAQMVDQVLPRLSRDLGFQETLHKGSVSLAGHSHGGAALGAGAVGLDASDVTLQDAGYGWYGTSWQQLREWFVTGKPRKHLRIISTDPESTKGAIGNTRNVTQTGLAQSDVKQVAASHKLKAEITPTPGDKKTARDGGMTLDGGFDLTIDGQPQGSLRIFTLKPKLPPGSKGGAHWGVKDQSMAATMRAGEADDDFGAHE